MQHKITTLNNSITVITENDESVESVALNCWVSVGSRYENPEICGISHFLEHMAFKGTKKRTAKQIAEEFDSIGGFSNAYTSKENTNYTARVLKEYLDVAVDIISDILQNSVFDENEIQMERSVILQEIAQSIDDYEDLVQENLISICFQNQSLGRNILGSLQTVNNISKDALVNYVETYYSSDKIFISAVGNLNHEKFVELIENKFNKISKKPSPKIEKSFFESGFNYLTKNTEQVHLMIGLEGESLYSEKYYIEWMLSMILGGSMSSRLFQEVREKRGLAYSIGSYTNNYSDNGIFTIYAGTSPEKLNELLNVISEECKKIIYKIDDSELSRAITQAKSSLLISSESISYRSESLVNNYAYHNRLISNEEILQKINNVTKEDLHQMMDKLIGKDSKISISAIGSISKMHDYQTVINLLQSR